MPPSLQYAQPFSPEEQELMRAAQALPTRTLRRQALRPRKTGRLIRVKPPQPTVITYRTARRFAYLIVRDLADFTGSNFSILARQKPRQVKDKFGRIQKMYDTTPMGAL